MTKTSKYFCAVSTTLFGVILTVFILLGGSDLLTSIGASLCLCLVQFMVWLIARKRTFLSYSIALLPACALAVALLRHNTPVWYLVFILSALLLIFMPKSKIPQSRNSTSLWVGTFFAMIILATFVGIMLQ